MSEIADFNALCEEINQLRTQATQNIDQLNGEQLLSEIGTISAEISNIFEVTRTFTGEFSQNNHLKALLCEKNKSSISLPEESVEKFKSLVKNSFEIYNASKVNTEAKLPTFEDVEDAKRHVEAANEAVLNAVEFVDNYRDVAKIIKGKQSEMLIKINDAEMNGSSEESESRSEDSMVTIKSEYVVCSSPITNLARK